MRKLACPCFMVSWTVFDCDRNQIEKPRELKNMTMDQDLKSDESMEGEISNAIFTHAVWPNESLPPGSNFAERLAL